MVCRIIQGVGMGAKSSVCVILIWRGQLTDGHQGSDFGERGLPSQNAREASRVLANFCRRGDISRCHSKLDLCGTLAPPAWNLIRPCPAVTFFMLCDSRVCLLLAFQALETN